MQSRNNTGWFLVVVLALTSFAWSGTHFSGERREFISAHSVTSELETILDSHSNELEAMIGKCIKQKPGTKCETDYAVKEFSWLPGYFVKFGVDRLKNAESLRFFIEKHQLNLLMVPQKYYYHIQGRPYDLADSNYLIISKKVELDQNSRINKEQMTQLALLVELHGSVDNHAGNMLPMKDGRVALVDTGSEGNYASWAWWDEDLPLTEEQKLFLGFVRFIGEDGDFLESEVIDCDAYELIVNKIIDIMTKQKNQGWYRSIIKEHVVEFTRTLPKARYCRKILRKYLLDQACR